MPKVAPAKDLLVLQGRLFSPAYAGSARWLIFKASTRRTFAAIGPDVVPDVIALLAGGSTPGEGPKNGESRPLPPDQIAKLIGIGVLDEEGESTEPPEGLGKPRNLTSLFQLASFDYPFHDYANPAAVKEYQLLIQSFLAMGAPPPTQIAYPGEAIMLPSIQMFEPAHKGITLEALSYLLAHAFRPIGSIHTDSLECIRRTSPSGGARHPTEALVILRDPLDGVPAGAYFYRSQDHSLVRAPSAVDGENGSPIEAPLSLVLWLKVERAMWRYRDLRALRPVLMDVGHILETLSVLSSKLGISGIATGPPPVTPPLSKWLDGPPVMTLHFEPNQGKQAPPPGGSLAGMAPSQDGAEFQTSPAFVMAFNKGLEGRVLWPTTEAFEMDLIDFQVMNHCIPSRRGDRLTTCRDICEAIPGATAERVQALRNRAALLPTDISSDFYNGMRLWTRYGWYLSCLAHLEAAEAWQNDPPEPQPIGFADGQLGELSTLYARRTTRGFSPGSITLEAVSALMTATFDTSPHIAPTGMQVFLSPTRVKGMEPGLYRWNGGLHPRGMPSERFRTPEGISSLVIGQASAGAGALAIWMICQAPTDNGAKYQDAIIRMGRLGQRLCLAATRAGLGVFLTPAITDALVAEMLRLDDPQKAVGYFFSVGIPAGASNEI